ncbi:hypothetical protein AK812_SmicGene45261 [Symbiodinium microadriaticum]|uniref:Uncharacterized protein n=1 Tax=Symbiodinium microadriaticum TaxID=2951 RepID=A0A1Q9BWJ3_SYMMI|nr:hypothetical protein AK812_SmicGene45261 [Symbiodinium microadriaticum]
MPASLWALRDLRPPTSPPTFDLTSDLTSDLRPPQLQLSTTFCSLAAALLFLLPTLLCPSQKSQRPWQAMAQAVQQRETGLPEGEVGTHKVELTV